MNLSGVPMPVRAAWRKECQAIHDDATADYLTTRPCSREAVAALARLELTRRDLDRALNYAPVPAPFDPFAMPGHVMVY